MARRIKDALLDSKEARRKLKVRGKPHWRSIERGLHLGYRRLKSGAGTWCIRRYIGKQKYEIEGKDFGIADDISDADGEKILTYWQAVDKARQQIAPKDGEAKITVAQAVESYIGVRDERDSKRKGRDIRSDAGQRLRRYVIGQPARGTEPERPPASLARVELRALEDTVLKDWCEELPEGLKAATRQRLINDFKAALNAAYAKHRKQLPPGLQDTIKHGLKAESDDDDEGADVPDSQVLTDAQITSLLRATREIDAEQEWGGDLYRLVTVMAATGARFSQVARLHVRDCQIANSRLMVPDSRKGRKKKLGSKPIPVGSEIIAALRPVVIRRNKDEWLLERWRYKQVKGGTWERDARGPWSTSELNRPWQAVRERAGINEATPYCLRHSSIVRGIRNNLPIRLVAAAHDTSVQIIERHYSRFIVGDLEKLLASAVVPLLPQDELGKVVSLR